MKGSGTPADLLVLGGGTAGLVAARTAAGFGARVLMVERDPAPGGDCLWTGCVPSKTLLAAARRVASARSASAYGLRVDGEVDLSAVLAQVRQAIATIAPVDSVATLAAAGVEVITGTGRFTGPHQLIVGDTVVRFSQAMIGTGVGPALPEVPGLAEVGPLTTDSVWALDERPGRLLILGGGATGCELAQAFARLDVAVVLVEARPRLLGEEDPDAARVVHEALVADGVEVRVGRTVQQVSVEEARLDDGSVVGFDRVLVATGRRPRTEDLGLAEADVRTDERGYVVVDEHLRTSNPRIWAAGDVTGHPQYTHLAGVHGSLVAANAVLGLHRSTASVLCPRVTYTDPEVAAVGVSSAEARGRRGLRVVEVDLAEVDRAITEQATAGFARLVLDRRSRLRGAVVVSPRAGETIDEAAVAIQHGLRSVDLVQATHAYPTFSDGLWNAAIADYSQQLRRPPTSWALGVLRRLRQPRVGT